MFSLYGKKALIIGGSCEIALIISNMLIDLEVFPVISYRSIESKEKIIKNLNNYKDKYSLLKIDFCDLKTLENVKSINSIDYMIDFVHEDYERLIGTASIEDIYSYYSSNISYRACLLNIISRKMIKNKKGRLIYISSTAAKAPNPGQGFYASSKLAVEALYKNIGIELCSRGITSVILRAGYINAGRGIKYLKEKKKNKYINVISKNKIAEIIIFLLTDSATCFNATELCCDAGFTATKWG